MPKTTFCRLCRNPIPVEAKFCTECDTYQDWRRYFGVSSTILSLLIALFSVLTVAIPVVRNALTPERSDIHCSLVSWGGPEATVLITNRGIRPAVVRGLRLAPIENKANQPPVSFAGELNDPILEPGKSRIITFHGVIGTVTTDLVPTKGLCDHYTLVLDIFPFRREDRTIKCDNWKDWCD